MSTFIIAEAGSCHDGKLVKAVELIQHAKEAGADAVKFQYWSSSQRMVRRRKAQDYYTTYERYRVPRHWLERLHAIADDCRIEFMCSSYLPEDVWAVAEHCQRLKIASFEANDPEHLVAHVGPVKAGRTVYVSCGMGASTRTVAHWLGHGLTQEEANDRVKLLYCVSAYPTPVDQLMLGRLRLPFWASGTPWDTFVGFSDHAPPDHTWTGALAVAGGAGVLERHIRCTDGDPSNPDLPHAMAPKAFRDYVRHVRYAEVAFGFPNEYKTQGARLPCEYEMARYRVGGSDGTATGND